MVVFLRLLERITPAVVYNDKSGGIAPQGDHFIYVLTTDDES